MSAERARAIEAKDIGSIEIVKSELPTGRDTIFVTSADRMPRADADPDSLEAARFGGREYAFQRKKISEASSEKLVAHVEAERAAERMRTADASPMSKTPLPPGPLRMKVRDWRAAGHPHRRQARVGSAARGARREGDRGDGDLQGKERLHLSRDEKGELEVTSGPIGRADVPDGGAVISVTTKMARRRRAKP